MSFHDDLFLTGTFLNGTFNEGAGTTPLDQALTELEKHSPSKCWIDYHYIQPGIADYTPLDEALNQLEK